MLPVREFLRNHGVAADVRCWQLCVRSVIRRYLTHSGYSDS